MSSHLEMLGFEPDFDILHAAAAENPVSDFNGVECLECRDESGAAYYLSLFHEYGRFEIRPHLYGESKIPFGVLDWVNTPDSDFESSLHGYIAPADPKDPESGLYPVVISIPDFPAVEDFDLPKTLDIQIAAFPMDFELYATEDSFREKNDSIAVHSCIPTGLFQEEFEPTVMLSGTVEKSEMKTNTMTGQSFFWLSVKTYGGAFDLVLTEEMVPELPEIGSVIYGSFYLSGKVLL